jgi:hypothetical protein
MEEEKNIQCELTQIWRVNANGKIATIGSDRNRPNELGIKYTHGKKKGQLKKNKALKEKDFERA